MSIRLPLTTVLDNTFGPSTTPGSASVAGVEAKTFFLPQDTDNIVMKVQSASVSGTGTISVLFQTSDDGGTTWYDVARSQNYGSAAGATSVLNGTALWNSIPVIGMGMRTTVSGVATSSASVLTQVSVLSGTGSAAASTLGVNQLSGLPILGLANRVCLIYSGNITTNDGVRVKVMVNSQSPHA